MAMAMEMAIPRLRAGFRTTREFSDWKFESGISFFFCNDGFWYGNVLVVKGRGGQVWG